MRPSATPTRCVLYLRISLDAAGDGLAIDRQRDACLRIARERGWVVIREYVDSSISAYKKDVKRPDYDQMVTDYAAGQFDALVCYDLDRLTRIPRQLEDWIDAAEDRGLKLVTASGEADLTTDGGQMFARMKAAWAKGESHRKGNRQRDAARQTAQRGYMPRGARSFGWELDGKPATGRRWSELATREESGETDEVGKMFARFHAGDSLVGIARWLESRAVPSNRGGPWSSHSVREILTNPRHAGIVVYKRQGPGVSGESYPGNFGALVDEALFAAVNEKLADPRRRTAFGTDRKHLGSGLYECGQCGKLVRATSAPFRYLCPDKHVTRLATPIDQLVTAVIRGRLALPDVALASDPKAGREALRATAELRRLRARLRQTERDYDNDVINGRRYKEKTDKIEADIAAAEARRSQAMAGSEVSSLLSAPDPVKAFDDAPVGVQQSAVRFFCRVELLHVQRGKRGFDPETVRITPRVVAKST